MVSFAKVVLAAQPESGWPDNVKDSSRGRLCRRRSTFAGLERKALQLNVQSVSSSVCIKGSCCASICGPTPSKLCTTSELCEGREQGREEVLVVAESSHGEVDDCALPGAVAAPAGGQVRCDIV